MLPIIFDGICTRREIDPKSRLFKPNQDCNHPFLIDIDLLPNRIPFGAKSIGKSIAKSIAKSMNQNLRILNWEPHIFGKFTFDADSI